MDAKQKKIDEIKSHVESMQDHAKPIRKKHKVKK